MWEGLIFICSADVATICDMANALWSYTTDPVYQTYNQCINGSFHQMLEQFPKSSVYQEMVQYSWDISCAQGL